MTQYQQVMLRNEASRISATHWDSSLCQNDIACHAEEPSISYFCDKLGFFTSYFFGEASYRMTQYQQVMLRNEASRISATHWDSSLRQNDTI